MNTAAIVLLALLSIALYYTAQSEHNRATNLETRAVDFELYLTETESYTSQLEKRNAYLESRESYCRAVIAGNMLRANAVDVTVMMRVEDGEL